MSNFFSKARHELKYALPVALGETVKSRLSPLMSTDSHYREGRYLVRSLYFDDMASSSFYEKEAGVEKRQKIRIRYYNLDAGYIVIEKKLKYGSMVRKRSAEISKETALSMMAGDYSPLLFSENEFLIELYGEMTSELYVPVVGVDYFRTAFVIPDTDIRVTLDERLSCFSPSGGLFDTDPPSIPVAEGRTVLEVKYGSYLPDFIPSALSDLPLQKEAFSKFALCRQRVEYPIL